MLPFRPDLLCNGQAFRATYFLRHSCCPVAHKSGVIDLPIQADAVGNDMDMPVIGVLVRYCYPLVVVKSHLFGKQMGYPHEFGYHSLRKNFEIANKAETKETITKAHTMAHESAKNKAQPDTGYQLAPPSRSYIPPTKAKESSSIAQAVGNVASTALNAAEEMISGAGGLINPQTHGDDYAEMAWQHKLRNQAKKKKKRGRSI